MTVADSERIRELKLAAKWGMDTEEKKKAVSELLQFGNEGVSAIQEILAVTAYDDVKQACLDAIRSIGRKQTVTLHKDEYGSKKVKDNHKHPVAKRRKKTITKRKSRKAKS
jgi:hypothetical protein